MAKNFRKQDECLNCHQTINDANYCSNCGQANSIRQIPLKEIFKDLFGEFFTFDSKFFRSFGPLVKKPGHLTNEYNKGKRSHYVFPLRLYIFTTILFFFIVSVNSKLTSDKQEPIMVSADSLNHYLTSFHNGKIDSTYTQEISRDLSDQFFIIVRPNDGEQLSTKNIKEMIAAEMPEVTMYKSSEISHLLTNQFKFKNYDELHEYPNSKHKRTKEEFDKKFTKLLDRNSDVIDDVISLLNTKLDSVQSEKLYKKLQLYKISERNSAGNSSSSFSISAQDSTANSLEQYIIDKAKILSNDEMNREDRLIRSVLDQLPKVMFLILPLFALLLKILYSRKKVLYINHLIFSLHLHSIFFLYLLFSILFPEWYVVLFTIFGTLFHLFLSLKNVYKQSAWKTFLKLILLLVSYLIPLAFGSVVLILLALLGS